MTVGKEEIYNRFGYHPGTSETIPKHELVREMFIAFAEFLDEAVPDGRAKSTALTKLQEAAMWSNFGIAEKAPFVLPTPAKKEPKVSEMQVSRARRVP